MPKSWSMMGWHFPDPLPTLAERATILPACWRDTVQSTGPGPAMCQSAPVINISDMNLVGDGFQWQVSYSQHAVTSVSSLTIELQLLSIQRSLELWNFSFNKHMARYFTPVVRGWKVFGTNLFSGQVPSLPGEMEQIKVWSSFQVLNWHLADRSSG